MTARDYLSQAKPDGPGLGAFEITPDDDADLAQVARQLLVRGDDGDIHVQFADGSEATWPAVAGEPFPEVPMVIVKVFADDTTATGIWGVV